MLEWMRLLLVQSITWFAVHGIRKINVISGRAVFVLDTLPKQSTDDLERIASAFRSSFCEILDPAFDDEDKVRLCWLGDEDICGAVRRRYLQSVPLAYVHYVEDQDGSVEDALVTSNYFTGLTEKLMKDDTQGVTKKPPMIHEGVKNCHWLSIESTSDAYLHLACQYNLASQNEDDFLFNPQPLEIVRNVLDRKLIAIPHRIHEDMNEVFALRTYMQTYARDVSCTKQSYWPLQRPALRIHLFPNEQAFISHGGELFDEIANDPKHFAMHFAAKASQMMRWRRMHWFFEPDRIMHSVNAEHHLLVDCSRLLNDPQVLNDRKRLSRTVHILFRLIHPEEFKEISDEIIKPTHWKPGFLKTFKRITHFLEILADKSHRYRYPWGKEEEQTMNYLEKTRALDAWEDQWDEIVMAELGLRKGDRGCGGFWKQFGIVIREIWKDLEDVERVLVKDSIVTWKAIDEFFDPSFTMNVILLQGPDMERSLLKEECLERGYSWKGLRHSIQWVDYDCEQEET